MKHFYKELANVWQEACRHIELQESTPRIASHLLSDLPLKQILIKKIDFESSVIRILAIGFPEPKMDASFIVVCSDEENRALKDWLLQGELLHFQKDAPPEVLSCLHEFKQSESSVIIMPISSNSMAGALVFIPQEGAEFDLRCQMIIKALVEPFTVAMENDARLRELTRLRKAAEADNQSLLNRLGRNEIGDTVIGQQTGLKSVVERINLVCQSDMPVLILGETGTGKELIARMIHTRSDRCNGPFLRINCGAIPAELVDSQLFGHMKGAFTGAISDKPGWFERADGGTLFLDEIGELPLAAQVRFLRVLQDGWIERIGASQPIHVDVRVVAATNQDLAAMVTDGSFREDLWYRIAVFPIIMPQLRQRLDDIPELANHFVQRAACRFKLTPVLPSEDDIRMLQSYDWPGNVREFAAVIDRAVILGNGMSLEISKSLGWIGSLPSKNEESSSQQTEKLYGSKKMTLDGVVRSHIEQILIQTRGRIDGPNGAAVILDINPHTLRGKMRKLGIDWHVFR